MEYAEEILHDRGVVPAAILDHDTQEELWTTEIDDTLIQTMKAVGFGIYLELLNMHLKDVANLTLFNAGHEQKVNYQRLKELDAA